MRVWLCGGLDTSSVREGTDIGRGDHPHICTSYREITTLTFIHHTGKLPLSHLHIIQRNYHSHIYTSYREMITLTFAHHTGQHAKCWDPGFQDPFSLLCTYTHTQIHKYTNTQVYKYTGIIMFILLKCLN